MSYAVNKIHKIIPVIFSAFSINAYAASANPMLVKTAGDLRDRCNPVIEVTAGAPIGANDRVVSSAACLGYITGFRDSAGFVTAFIVFKQNGGHVSEKDILERSAYCEKPGITVGEIAKMAVAYIERHPAEEKKLAGLVLTKMLIEEMPCP